MMEQRVQFCTCKEPLSTEIAVIDMTEYAICDKCGLPIENSAEIAELDE